MKAMTAFRGFPPVVPAIMLHADVPGAAVRRRLPSEEGACVSGPVSVHKVKQSPGLADRLLRIGGAGVRASDCGEVFFPGKKRGGLLTLPDAQVILPHRSPVDGCSGRW